MSVKRTRDPAGLLGDHVRIDLTNPQPGDTDVINELMEYNSPRRRIERLRRHAQLVSSADRLDRELIRLSGSADHRLHAEIASAEQQALYLDAAPKVIRDQVRQAGTRKERRPEITEWIDGRLALRLDENAAAMWAAAPEWLRDKIGIDRFKKRITKCKKRRK